MKVAAPQFVYLCLSVLLAAACSEAKKPGKFGNRRVAEDKQIARKTKANKNDGPPATYPCADGWDGVLAQQNIVLTSCCLGTGGQQSNDQSALLLGVVSAVVGQALQTEGSGGECKIWSAAGGPPTVVDSAGPLDDSEAQACYDYLNNGICGTISCTMPSFG